MSRFLALTQIGDGEREIARGLAEASLDAYHVASGAAGATIELVSLTDGAHVHVFADGGFELLDVGDTLVARIVHNTSIATAWGLGARFDGEHQRRWRARIAALPSDRAQAALILLHFHPDDAAEPLPDDRDLRTVSWRVDDDDEIIEALTEDDELESLGEHIPSGWAFALLDDAACGRVDLGGWADDEEIEVARVIVCECELTVVSADYDALDWLVAHIKRSIGGLIASPLLRRAA